MSSQLLAAFVQGSASFIITLVMIRGVTFLIDIIASPILRIFMPAVITVFITSTCLISMHWLTGTPNILTTVAAPITVALLFCLYTNYKICSQAE